MFSTEDFLARREQERQIIDEGQAVWRHKKEMDVKREIEEKKQIAIPQERTFFILDSDSNLEGTDSEFKLRMMLKSYNPWGKPGNGAPIPGALQRTKLILDEPDISDMPTSVLTLGRPGHGAPLRTSSGKTKTYLRSDPSIRFQFNEPSRKSVDNDLRYRCTDKDKENYRNQLDAIITQKRQLRNEIPRQVDHPEKNKGWSNEMTLRRIPQMESEQMFEISGGVELVPLLAKHRGSPRRPLPTTDITRMSRLDNNPPKTAQTEIIYHHELTDQVSQRQLKMQEARHNDFVSSQRHHDTWKGLWGRPGHGAPKGSILAKEKLDVLLYQLPARRLSAS